MVRHKGVAKRVKHDKAEDRAECRNKKCGRDFDAAPHITPREVNHRTECDSRHQPCIIQRMCRRDAPSRINKGQIRRPDEFAEIKPNGMAGDEDAFNRTQVEKRSACTLMVAFPPDCQQTHPDGQDKKRNDLDQAPLVNRLFLQPENQK